MKYRELQGSRMAVSEITFGCWELGGGQWEKQSDEINIEAIQTAFSLGITSFDTAEGYGAGHSEEILGTALKGKRDECFIATKISPSHLGGDDLKRSLENSLKRLQTDYIDLYYVHWPNNEIPIEDTMAALASYKEQGVIKLIGLSNFTRKQMEEAMTVARVDAIQPEYSLLHREIERDVVPYCVEHNIGILSYSSIAKGILSGVYHIHNVSIKDEDFRRNRRLFTEEHFTYERPLVEAIHDIAKAKDVSMSQVAISWLLAQPGMTSAIVGTQNLKHVRDNALAVDVALSADERARLDELSRAALARIDA